MILNFMKPTLIICAIFIQLSVYAEIHQVPTPPTSYWGVIDPRGYVPTPHDVFHKPFDIKEDIIQTFSLDCPLLAGIASLVYNDPQRILNMIKQSPDYKEVTISLFNAKDPNEKDFYKMSAVRDTSTLGFFGERYEMTSQGRLWVHLIERAYKHRLSLTNQKLPNSTSAAGLSPIDVLRSLLGPDSLPFLPVGGAAEDLQIHEKSDLDDLLSNPKVGGVGIVGLKFGVTRKDVRNNHSYAILGVKGDTVQIFNPISEEGSWSNWALHHGANYFRVVSIPKTELLKEFSIYYVPFGDYNQKQKEYIKGLKRRLEEKKADQEKYKDIDFSL